uniref:Alpha-1,3-glucosyltransferase n=1 Tax=Trieres chinensis TaxID=1514140 RepID=A0A7S1Z6G9_TRICV|mmetsp:Transcript_18712/g.37979  ORF Transcript_18712/g.37979 Transcript_18712/m.37979 type:complete len:571 (+) Transcript_18712:31-1743(+)
MSPTKATADDKMPADDDGDADDGGSALPIPAIPSILILSSAILLRSLVGFHHHSGEGGHHGKDDAYGGDYEAQRHWMELTYHLPIGEWYSYDLTYWGLDYPPLTAYVSYVCGYLSDLLVGPETVALKDSRGYEDGLHKSFMRGTVLVLDVAIYFTAVWAIARRTCPRDVVERMWTVVLALAQPAVILIDHGHFQYNTVSLGLALWSFHFATLKSFRGCVIGSVLFCLSLNFKQMSLYYAPAVFAYLLGRCFAPPERAKTGGAGAAFIGRFCALGATVIFTFVALWVPFALYSSPGVTAGEAVMQIVRRLFPFQRGLFEDKVSNLWCALSVKPLSIRRRIPLSIQPLLAMFGTLFLAMPSCVALFHYGRKTWDDKDVNGENLRRLLWGAAACALSFFLASFQVHEKSILMAVSPISMLMSDGPLFSAWFSLASTWTLWPLLVIDRLQGAYFACSAVVVALLALYGRPAEELEVCRQKGEWGLWDLGLGRRQSGWMWFATIVTAVIMVALHALETSVAAPESLPDLFPVLWSLIGCVMFCWSWLCCSGTLYEPLPLRSTQPGKDCAGKVKNE